MTDDERSILELVATWLAASKNGDLPAILDLMTNDVIFMVPGSKPFGKDAFAMAFEGIKQVRIEGRGDIQELQILGDWAYLRNYIEMTATPPNGDAMRRTGYTLTILRKESDGRWRITRDTNLLAIEKSAN
ncbi:MAG TPA: SgcJ/EcaC family oxidoreductase [Methylocella sp.]|nr:SgcJ/EcaC family oxidoreductase [Methylocella sp.]